MLAARAVGYPIPYPLTSVMIVNVGFEFQIKRGVINSDDLEAYETGLLQQCLDLCRSGKHDDAVALLLPRMNFEWDWSNGDGDAEEFFVDPSLINFDCSAENCSLAVGERDGQLVITATVAFSVEGKDGINADELMQWLDDNAAWSCGHVSGGWGYDGSDGENVWLVSLDGKDVTYLSTMFESPAR